VVHLEMDEQPKLPWLPVVLELTLTPTRAWLLMMRSCLLVLRTAVFDGLSI
jgi:hypothetical protein